MAAVCLLLIFVGLYGSVHCALALLLYFVETNVSSLVLLLTPGAQIGDVKPVMQVHFQTQMDK